MNFQKRCEDCAELCIKNGVWTCNECFGQKCADIDDCPCGVVGNEVDTMTEKAKEITRYEQSTNERKKSTKERKVDDAKLEILQIVQSALVSNGYNATIEKEIALHFGNFTLKLIRHRTKK